MAIYIKHSGTWNLPKDIFVNVSGDYKRTKAIYINSGGSWKLQHKTANISANVSSVNLHTLAGSPTTPITFQVTVDTGVYVSASSSTVPSIDIGSFAQGSKIYLINNGIIFGAGGAGGFTPWSGVFQEAGNNSIRGKGGSNPSNAYSGSGISGTSASPGGAAIRISANVLLDIYNYNSIIGGGGGAGGNGNNNAGGGNGGDGGPVILKSGPAGITLYNQSSGIFAGGGGGAPGSGNRTGAVSVGGDYGNAAVITNDGSPPSAANFGAIGQAGKVVTGATATKYLGIGTFNL